jgi:hypothetical protein
VGIEELQAVAQAAGEGAAEMVGAVDLAVLGRDAVVPEHAVHELDALVDAHASCTSLAALSFDLAAQAAPGARHFSPGKRAKSRSSVIHSHPCSIANAAYQASLTFGPVMFELRHTSRKIAQ